MTASLIVARYCRSGDVGCGCLRLEKLDSEAFLHARPGDGMQCTFWDGHFIIAHDTLIHDASTIESAACA
jgi:hypothetical protein